MNKNNRFLCAFIGFFCLAEFVFGYQQQWFLWNQEWLDWMSMSISPMSLVDWNDLWNMEKAYLWTWDLSFFKNFDLTLASYWLDLWPWDSLLLSIFSWCWDNWGQFYWLATCYKRGVLVFCFYHGFLLVLICILFLKKRAQEKLKILFYVWLWLFLTIWFVNMYEDFIVLKVWIPWFKKDMSYFKLLDYYWFVDKVRDELDLDFNKKNDCKFSIEYGSDFRIDMFWSLDVWFKPCELALPWDLVDYKIYYKKEIPEWDLDKKVLLEFNGSYLLENNSNKCLNHHYYYF